MASDSGSSDGSFDDSSSDEEEQQDVTEENVAPCEADEEDEIIRTFKREQEKKRDHPPDLVFEDHIVDICFHPTENILAVANIVGDVIICKYTDDESVIINTWELHLQACRDIEFDSEGGIMYSTAKDRAIMLTDVKTGKLSKCVENAHDVPIYCLRSMDENLICTGDDDGRVRFWDMRKNDSKPIYQTKKHDDYISDMITNEGKTYLVCCSGDGTISSIDLRNRKFFLQSDDYDEEFTALGLFRSETKVLASTNKGKMFLYNWEEFGYHSDEFPGPKHAINGIIPITENILVSGNEDGVLRATHLFPHRHLGIVGQHSMPIECVDICNNGELIASSSHNNDVKFWNVKYFENFKIENPKEKKNKKHLTNNLPSSQHTNRKDFFTELGT